jgi:hypothetical protein
MGTIGIIDISMDSNDSDDQLDYNNSRRLCTGYTNNYKGVIIWINYVFSREYYQNNYLLLFWRINN